MFLKKFFKAQADKIIMSFHELTKLKSLTAAAMLVALFAVLSLVNIPLSTVIEIRFTFIPLSLSGMLFGPVVGMLVGALGDVLGYLVHPTGPFFPGFSLSTALSGMIFGFAFYKNRAGAVVTAVKSVAATFIVAFAVNWLLQTYWLNLIYGMPYGVTLVTRLIKTSIMFVFESIAVYGLYRVCERTDIKSGRLTGR